MNALSSIILFSSLLTLKFNISVLLFSLIFLYLRIYICCFKLKGCGSPAGFVSLPFGERNTKPKLADTKASTIVSALDKTVKNITCFICSCDLDKCSQIEFYYCFEKFLLIRFFFLFFCRQGLLL